MAVNPFPIRTPRDLLKKAKREIDRLDEEASGGGGEPTPIAVADLTYDAACTLWHVTDWIGFGTLDVVRDVVPHQMNKPSLVRADRFQRRLRALSADLRICWGLALRFKHLELENEEARDMFEEEATISIRPAFEHVGIDMSAGAVDHITVPIFSSVPPPLQFSHRPFAAVSGPSMATLHPKVTYRKQRMRLTDVYRRAYTFLDELLRKHGL